MRFRPHAARITRVAALAGGGVETFGVYGRVHRYESRARAAWRTARHIASFAVLTQTSYGAFDSNDRFVPSDPFDRSWGRLRQLTTAVGSMTAIAAKRTVGSG